MGLPVEINPLFVSSTGGYQIGRSLRFRSSASAYLNRTPASASNRRTWTWSGWVKLGVLSSIRVIFGAGQNATTGIDFGFYSDNTFFYSINGVGTWNTTAVFRDPSAWYHVVFAFDSTQATQANRSIVYINNVNYSFTSNGVVLNNNYDVNNNIAQYFGQSGVSSQYLDGYLAEVNFIDGSALTSSSFGAYDANGVWQPAKYTGTYGTNGFYLPFSNGTSTTTLGYDQSGNSNNWTTNNISLTAGTTYDWMQDVPTNNSSTAANFAVLNSVIPANSGFTNTFADGNLNGTITGTGGSAIFSSITMSTGSWYWETYVVNVGAGTNIDIGICSTAYPPSTMSNANGAIGGKAGGYSIFDTSGVAYKANNNVATAYGVTFTNGDIIMTAFDATNGKIWFGKNGTWMASGDPATAANPTFSGIPSASYWAGFGNAGGVSRTVQAIMNFGQRPFTYTPPTGFVALNTQNLPDATITKGNQHFDATLWTGDGTSPRSITNAAGFKPDLVWVKMRSGAYQHGIADSVRGGNAILHSNSTAAEDVNWQYGYLSSFNSNGFTMQSGSTSIENFNLNGSTFVGWQWKGGGTAVSNNSGTITSSVSTNASAGFSVVTYTGTGANATVGHGLGVAPSMIIVKSRNLTVEGWNTYHTSLAAGYVVQLNATIASTSASTMFTTTLPTSSVFSVGTNTGTNGSGSTYVAYCFAAVSGYSAFGSYNGTGSTDGAFVYTGFRPRWIMMKCSSSAGLDWNIVDTSRNTYNVTTSRLWADLSNAEDSTDNVCDILSNGFKLRSTNTNTNQSGSTYVYACFSENPFNYSRAR